MGYRITAIWVLVVLAGTCWAAPDPEASPAPAPDSFKYGASEWVPLLSAIIYGVLGLVLNIVVFLLIHLLNGGIIPKQLLELVYQLLPFALNNG